jgi:lipase chaperone LimK
MNYEFNLEEIKNSIQELDILPEEKKEKIKGQIQSRLSHLTGFLNGTDYQVIKCYEAQLGNDEMPYNIQDLLAQRKAWRDEINALEFEIAMLG